MQRSEEAVKWCLSMKRLCPYAEYPRRTLPQKMSTPLTAIEFLCILRVCLSLRNIWELETRKTSIFIYRFIVDGSLTILMAKCSSITQIIFYIFPAWKLIRLWISITTLQLSKRCQHAFHCADEYCLVVRELEESIWMLFFKLSWFHFCHVSATTIRYFDILLDFEQGD